jgi:aerobic carbon-monoxide dehydrogenase medium subunit
VKPGTFDLHRPEGLDEAIAIKARYEGEASVLAGGQSLIPMMNFRLARPRALVDLNGIDALAGITVGDGVVRVGAMTRQRALERHADAIAACPLLGEALGNVAHQVIRNRGTVGGSVAHADAAAELPAALLTVGGRVRTKSPGGERVIASDDLFEFHMTTSLEPDELLVEVEFPALPPRTGVACREVTRRHGDYALAGVCATVTLDDQGGVESARLGCLGVAPTPVRSTAAEDLLAGNQPGTELFAAAGEAARDVVDAVDEEQASVAYRRRLVAVLTRRALEAASGRANGGT